jgi:hypothetical protein
METGLRGEQRRDATAHTLSWTLHVPAEFRPTLVLTFTCGFNTVHIRGRSWRKLILSVNLRYVSSLSIEHA